VIRSAESVEEIDSEEIYGVRARGLAATITNAEFIQPQLDDTALPTTTAPDPDVPEMPADLAERLGSMPVTLQVWVEDEGMIRRMRIVQSLADVASHLGQDNDTPLSGLGTAMTIDISD
jgi:hypothetical protein